MSYYFLVVFVIKEIEFDTWNYTPRFRNILVFFVTNHSSKWWVLSKYNWKIIIISNSNQMNITRLGLQCNYFIRYLCFGTNTSLSWIIASWSYSIHRKNFFILKLVCIPGQNFVFKIKNLLFFFSFLSHKILTSHQKRKSNFSRV